MSEAEPRADELFIDLGSCQENCHGEAICGDTVSFRRLPGGRVIAVLSDGLGHGVKANILSSITSTMALRLVAERSDIVHSAEIIMDALPVCQVRKISYATFSIVDIRPDRSVHVFEMGNPEFLWFRQGQSLQATGETLLSPKYRGREMRSSRFTVEPGDRLIVCSDGITQAGLGTPGLPSGWGNAGCAAYAAQELARNPYVAARELATAVLREAIAHEPNRITGDDMSALVIYLRRPRRLLLFTGAPFHRERDRECARQLAEFDGVKIVCGGTTGQIVSRELGLELTEDRSTPKGDLPPGSCLPGIDLVTEGIYTLSRAIHYLEHPAAITGVDPATRLVDLLLAGDLLEFLVGTRINEAHQDPNMPIELEFRRNLVQRLAAVLREKYAKSVQIRLV